MDIAKLRKKSNMTYKVTYGAAIAANHATHRAPSAAKNMLGSASVKFKYLCLII